MPGADAFLRRLERTAIVVCLTMAGVALAIARGRPGPAIAVLAGGLLIGVSYWTIRLGVHALADAFCARQRRRALRPGGGNSCAANGLDGVARAAAVRFTRSSGVGMIARLRLHPIGLLAGASSVAAAASIEAGRLLLKKSRP